LCAECDGGGIQGGMNLENGGQLGELQQLADEIAGSSQLDRALAGLRRQGNRYECSEASGVDHFHAAEVDHDSTGLGRKLGNFGHGFTYSGHPVAAAVAVKTLEIYARDKIFAAAAARMPQFQQQLKKLGEHPLVGEARGMGLMGGLELVADKASKRAFEPKLGVAARCVRFAEEGGLIVRAVIGDTVTICPPLIIQADEIDELFARLARALDRTLDWAKRERLLVN